MEKEMLQLEGDMEGVDSWDIFPCPQYRSNNDEDLSLNQIPRVEDTFTPLIFTEICIGRKFLG
jgi:hypothetical protein